MVVVRVMGSSEQTSRRGNSNTKHASSPKKRGDSNSKHLSSTPKTISPPVPASSHRKKKHPVANMAADTPKERRRIIDLSSWKHSYSNSMEERMRPPLSHKSTAYGQITSTPSPLVQSLSVFQTQKINPSTERMLVSVTVMGSIWKVRFIASAQATVKVVIGAALAEIVKEGRKLSAGFHVEAYELYISQFSLRCKSLVFGFVGGEHQHVSQFVHLLQSTC